MTKKSSRLRSQLHNTDAHGATALAATVRQAAQAHSSGQLNQAEELYRRVIKQQSQNFNALHMLGVIALQTGRPIQGIALIQEALRLKPTDALALANLANGFVLITEPLQALESYDRALQEDPRFAGALSNRGNLQQSLCRYADAAQSFEQLLQVAPGFDFALGNLFHSRRHDCDWRDYDSNASQVELAIGAGTRADRPFSFLSVSDSLQLQRKSAAIYAAYQCPTLLPRLWRGEIYRHQRIRVAYISADFRDHIVLRFMLPLFERHDRERFEIIAVSLTAGDGSELVARSKHAFSQFLDVSKQNDAEVATRLRELEVDIAVDLTGFTQNCRPGVFARRPAPVQINFLGFPATMGVPWMDYIIADEFVIPESLSDGYAEKIVRMPVSFQFNDSSRLSDEQAPLMTRTEAGLPSDGLVLCSFSNSYKLNPTLFAIWSNVLSRTPGSVLWLLASAPSVQENLKRTAQDHGVAPERLIFAERVSYAAHLSRLRLADLFLDTLPFNAGATASDVLWAGVPILTCSGEAFASRMAGSLLQAIGLPELIASNLTEYEQLALELAGDCARLLRLKTKLAGNLGCLPLFDGDHYRRHLEAAYRHMYERTQRREPPASFTVAQVPQQ